MRYCHQVCTLQNHLAQARSFFQLKFRTVDKFSSKIITAPRRERKNDLWNREFATVLRFCNETTKPRDLTVDSPVRELSACKSDESSTLWCDYVTEVSFSQLDDEWLHH